MLCATCIVILWTIYTDRELCSLLVMGSRQMREYCILHGSAGIVVPQSRRWFWFLVLMLVCILSYNLTSVLKLVVFD